MEQQITAFFQDRIVARGSPDTVTRAIEQGWPGDQGAVHVFDDADGRPVDLDLWDAAPKGRGRPKLGVVPREVTLLPRHWAWLGAQPGGASAAIRRLVDEARKGPRSAAAARDGVYRFITAMAGDRPGYEEALRALYRDDAARFCEIIADWPKDVCRYTAELLGGSA